MAVDNVHPAYAAMVPSWEKMAEVCSCEDTIHLLGEKYLPRLSGQNDTKYEAYKKRASFVTFTKRTIEAFCGMVMRKSVHLEGYESINIDGKGGDIDAYVGNLIETYLTYSRCGSLVDYPEVPEGMVVSIADEIEKNIRPRILFYGPADIINWKLSVENNVEVLSMVVLREEEDVSEDEFSHDVQYRYRVLDLGGVDGTYRQRLYNHRQELVKEITPKKNGEPMKVIPFVIHGGAAVRFPVLLSVADQNLHHYMMDADYKHGLHYVALPTPWVSGIDKDNAPPGIGPTVLWVLENDLAKCGMLEFTGAGLSKIAEAMESTVETIVILASRVIAPEKSSNDESALAAAIRSNAETSSLAGIVDRLSKEMTNLVRILVWWDGGNPTEAAVKINSDFMPSELTGTDVLSYITAWIKGGISYRSLFEVLKRGEIIKGDRLLEDELEEIDEEQKKRLQEEMEKTENEAKIKGEFENKDEEGDGLRKVKDPESRIKQDRRTM